MALSTSELVADNMSASSVGGASDTRLVLTSTSGPDVGAWLAEARLAISPDTVRRALFFLKGAPALIYLPGINPGNMVTRPYRCGGVSIRTALLFSLRGHAAPCWVAAAGSASRLEGTPYETPLVYGDQK